MDNINIELFKREWIKVEKKLEDIALLGNPFECGHRFDGVSIETEGVIYKSSTYFSGCGTDSFSFCILWEDLNKPISFFEEEVRKYRQGIEERKKTADQEKAEKERQNEIKMLIELRQKHPNI